MANLSYNHLWLIGTSEVLAPWTNADPWAALERLPDWFALFHPEHGYPVGRVMTFETHRTPVSVFDQERRAGIHQQVDQFLAFADEGWWDAGHEWRLRAPDARELHRASGFNAGQPTGVSPDPACPCPWAWAQQRASTWWPLAIERARTVPVPIAPTGNALVLRRALWRDDATAVHTLLDAGLAPRTPEDWWSGVADAIRPRAWPVPAWPTTHRAEGPSGQALFAWLNAMPKAWRQPERIMALVAPRHVDPGVKAATRAWWPVDSVWTRAELALPAPEDPANPCAEAAVLDLWRASSPERRARLADAWADHLRETATSFPVNRRRTTAEARAQHLLDELAQGPGWEALEPVLPGLHEAWPIVARWHEDRVLRNALPSNEVTGRPRARL